MARPIETCAVIGIVSVPTKLQVMPSGEAYALTVSPIRASFTQYGAATRAPAVFVLSPPGMVRRWNARPFPADITMNAWVDAGFNVARIITPAFVQADVFWT